ncbi:MAG: cold adaptation protein AtcA [Aeromonas sp.]
MATSFAWDHDQLDTLLCDARDNIESYQDQDDKQALAQFTAQMKGMLQADTRLLSLMPEYLPIALYGRVKFPPQAQPLWRQWLSGAAAPTWDEFKTSVAFGKEDLALVKTVREVSERQLIEACAVLFMLAFPDALKRGYEPAALARDEDEDDRDEADRNYMGYDRANDNDDDLAEVRF